MNLPNCISLARLLTVPVNVWLILNGQWRAAFFLFTLAGISDAVDGIIAKRFGMQTRLGRYLDPIADKAMLVAVYIALGAQGELSHWLVILVVSRDVLIVGGVFLLFIFGFPYEPAPRWSSKVNTVAQIATAAAVLAHLGFVPDLPTDWFLPLVILTGVTTAVSGADYLIHWGRRLTEMERTQA